MVNFNFNMYGLGTVIVLILISLILNWIIKINFVHKYREISTKIDNNVIIFAKEYADLNNMRLRYCLYRRNFWTSDVQAKAIYVEKQDFYSNSLYALLDVLFKTIMTIRFQKHPYIKYQICIKIVVAIVSWCWAIFMIWSFWIGVIVAVLIIMIMLLVEVMISIPIIKVIKKQVIWILERNGISQHLSKKSFTFHNFYFIDKYINVFSEAWLAGFIQFKKWGHDA